ncbi:MAG: zinc metalloprotease HtpX [Sulfurovaceae bacterium]
MERLKTYGLMIGLTVLFIWFGGLIGGQTGMIIAFVITLGMNFYAYFYSDQMVLKHYKAVPVERGSAKELYEIVEQLTRKAELPMPKIYIIPDGVPNAFATGRDYDHAVVAVTEGLLKLLTKEEIEAVLAHELSHIKHYDMLIGTVAATISGAIALLANFGIFFGHSENRPNPIVMIALMLIMPLAASVIQMSVSRSREFMADEGAAKITGHPEWLQSALLKLESYAKGNMMQNAEPESAHMFIINPLTGKNFSMRNLFSTHPTTEQRVERLEALKKL